MLWDLGEYEPLRPSGVSAEHWLERGFLRLLLHGTKLRGLWELVRLPERARHPNEEWLLVKLHDHHAEPSYDPESEPRSATTGRDRAEIEAAAGAAEAPETEAAASAVDCGVHALESPGEPGDRS